MQSIPGLLPPLEGLGTRLRYRSVLIKIVMRGYKVQKRILAMG